MREAFLLCKSFTSCIISLKSADKIVSGEFGNAETMSHVQSPQITQLAFILVEITLSTALRRKKALKCLWVSWDRSRNFIRAQLVVELKWITNECDYSRRGFNGSHFCLRLYQRKHFPVATSFQKFILRRLSINTWRLDKDIESLR